MRINTMSAHGLAQNWRLIALRGLSAVLFGLAAFIWPNLTLVSLLFLFGAYLLVDGLLAVVTGLTRHNGSRTWWLLLVEGLMGIAAGVLTFLSPGYTAIVLLYMIAVWAVVTGMVEIVSAIRLRADIKNEGLLALSGVVSVMLGMVLFVWPELAALSLVWLLGVYALVFGLLQIGLGLQLWNWQNSAGSMPLQPVVVEVGRHPRRPAEK